MSQPHRACKPSEVIGLKSPGSVSLDVSCSRVSLPGICLLWLGSPKLRSPPSTLLSTAGLCSWVAWIALCPRAVLPDTCSERDLPKLRSKLSRSWLSAGPLLTPGPLARLLAVGLSLPLCAHASATPVCLMGAAKSSSIPAKSTSSKTLMLLWS